LFVSTSLAVAGGGGVLDVLAGAAGVVGGAAALAAGGPAGGDAGAGSGAHAIVVVRVRRQQAARYDAVFDAMDRFGICSSPEVLRLRFAGCGSQPGPDARKGACARDTLHLDMAAT
jgi:hypothetical protein